MKMNASMFRANTDGFPDRIGGMRVRAGVRSGDRLRDRHRVTHHRQDPREPEVLGQDPDAEGGDELQNDRGRHVLHAVQQAEEEPAQRRTDHHAAGHRQQKRRRNRLG